MMIAEVISKPVYQILSELTQEPRVEVALSIAIKDWVRLKLKDAKQQRVAFEQQYGMDFVAFKSAWEKGIIPDATSYEVEQNYWEWEASVTDENRLQKMLATLSCLSRNLRSKLSL